MKYQDLKSIIINLTKRITGKSVSDKYVYLNPKKPFYLYIKMDQIDLYQQCFDEIISTIHLDNYDKRAKSKPFDKSIYQKDEKNIERIVNKAHIDHKLIGPYIQVMTEQYYFADPWSIYSTMFDTE